MYMEAYIDSQHLNREFQKGIRFIRLLTPNTILNLDTQMPMPFALHDKNWSLSDQITINGLYRN